VERLVGDGRWWIRSRPARSGGAVTWKYFSAFAHASSTSASDGAAGRHGAMIACSTA